MIHNAQKFINEATPEQKQQITTDMLFLLAHTQLQIELLDHIKDFKTVWKQTLKRKAMTLMEETEPILKLLLEDLGEGSQEQGLFLVNKVKELNYMAITEFNNTYNPKVEIKEDITE